MASYTTAGKFFLRDGEFFEVKGVTYGPFGPAAINSGLVGLRQLEQDFELITGIGLNTIRTYELPDEKVLNLAADHGIAVLATVPWSDHVDFLANSESKESGREAVARAAGELGEHPALLGLVVGNEISSPLIRWMGDRRVRRYLEELVELGRETAPEMMFSYASYPSTEYLEIGNVDFLTFNVFLEEESVFQKYLRRLQLIAGDRPLVIGEFGLDSLANGEARQAEVLAWGIRAMREGGCAGSVMFSFSDAWYRGGRDVEGWAFGLVDGGRNPKPAAEAVRKAFALAPGEAEHAQLPSFSVICCTHNGARRVVPCLESLVAIDYPDYEVLVIDDGSTDGTRGELERFAARNSHRMAFVTQEHAGLSVARNRGAELAKGEILAFIDDDACADSRWLRFLAVAYGNDAGHVAIGGPNIFPAATSWKEACVAAAPGRPHHVMLNETCAEHIPGVNLSVRKDAFFAVGGFDPCFRRAGDDVDFCWRVIDAGCSIGFCPGAMVWHAPRRTFRAYLKQQRGYGHAEAMLFRKHPLRFGAWGGIRWRGSIYGPLGRGFGQAISQGMIYRGTFGLAGFQAVYGRAESNFLSLIASPLWMAAAVIGAIAGCFWSPNWLFAAGMFLINLGTVVFGALRAQISAPWNGWKVRLGLSALYFLQPLLRGSTRLLRMFLQD